MTITIDGIVTLWSDPKTRPLFKGKLIDPEGCVCAQGSILRVSGYTDEQLRDMSQSFADAEVAKILGISRAHAVLLRIVNDRQDGCPQDVLAHPEKVLGPEATKILAFWRMLDRMTPEQWAAAGDAAWAAARAAAGDAARAAAGAAAGDAARAAAGDAARAAAGAAAGASNEIQGAAILAEKGIEPYFLKIFGIKSWKELEAL